MDAESGIALGFRRLAIVDLTPTGHQPMISADGRFVIVFNGEIYNFRELKDELKSLGATFRGTSDTEVMLASFSQWGVKAGVQRFNGMFAFALWDCKENTLFLARDRFGVKPLYYGWQGNSLLFGSELKALRAHPAFSAEIHRDALALFLRHNYVPAPYSIYTGIYKLLPGCILRVQANTTSQDFQPEPYWVAQDVIKSAQANPFQGDEREAIEALDVLLRRSVRQHMIADVPLGAFLSGGIDSSTVVALMQAQSLRPVKTFTIGFHEMGFDEARYARAVAEHLGTDHTELYVTPEDARNVIPLLPQLYDEPFSDSSQIPTYLVSQLARRDVTVSLSGDGGDELFGGYNRYLWATKIWSSAKWLPQGMRSRLAHMIQDISPSAWAGGVHKMSRVLPAVGKLPNAVHKVYRFAEILQVRRSEEIYFDIVSHWKDPQSIVINSHEPKVLAASWDEEGNPARFIEQMMYLDLMTYLPDDILAKVDRASMGVSLETRVPFVDDHEVMEFAWKLPLSMKIKNGEGKWILRKVLSRYVPKEKIDRPKMGFGVPIDSWLRGPLREWSEELLNEDRIRRENYFDPTPIRRMWLQHLSGQENHQYCLWDVLMFQAWLQSLDSA